MDTVKLVRKTAGLYGIFGELLDDKGSRLCYTLEHSYNNVPKIPPGTYTCKRGLHTLLGMNHTFETFEITGVTGHTNILIHTGNFNNDSSGCVLIGEELGSNCILESRKAFNAFMKLQEGLDTFMLTVSNAF